mgnify:CR=1
MHFASPPIHFYILSFTDGAYRMTRLKLYTRTTAATAHLYMKRLSLLSYANYLTFST